MEAPGLSSRINELCQSSQLSVGIVTEAITASKKETSSEIGTAVTTLSGHIGTATATLPTKDHIDTKIGTVTKKIDVIQTATDKLPTKEHIDTEIGTVTQKIADVKTATDKLATKDDVATKIKTVTEAIVEMKTTTDKLATKDDVATEIKTVTEAIAKMKNAADELAKKAYDNSKLEDVSKRIEKIEADLKKQTDETRATRDARSRFIKQLRIGARIRRLKLDASLGIYGMHQKGKLWETITECESENSNLIIAVMPGADEQVGVKDDEIEVRMSNASRVDFQLGRVKIDHLRERTYAIWHLDVVSKFSGVEKNDKITLRPGTLKITGGEIQLNVTGSSKGDDKTIKLKDVKFGASPPNVKLDG
eukprot:30186_1